MREVRTLASLAWPVVIGQIGLVGMGAVDLLMVGGLGRDATAAVGLGNTWSFGTVVIALGVGIGMDPLLTQAYGRGRPREAGAAAIRGLVLVSLLCVPVIALHLMAASALSWLQQPPAVVPLAADYARVVATSVPALVYFGVVRQLLQGSGQMRPAMWVIALGNVVNVAGNAWLIDAYGVVGVAWSTVLVRWVMLLALVALGGSTLAAARPSGILQIVRDTRGLVSAASLAVPVGFQWALEVWAFNAGSIVAGWLGATAVAAHVASLNAAALAFMVPMGIAAAASTRIGNLEGAGRDWRPAARRALGMGAGIMVGSGALFLFFPRWIGRAYNPDPEVVALVGRVLPVAALFGLFDGVQVVSFGILRGLGDTRLPALFNLLGYWVLGLPLGTFLALRVGMGLSGVWVGLAFALATVSTLLVLRIARHARLLDVHPR